MAMELFQILARHARDRGASQALRIIGPDARKRAAVSYAELVASVEQAAKDFARSDDPVELRLPNGLDFVVRFLAILRAGRTLFAINRSEPFPTEPSALGGSGSDLPGSLPHGRGSDGALILRSSGTTGLPKLVLRDGPSLDAVARNTARAIGLTAEDRVLVTIPQCHSYGIENGLLAPLWAGATLVVCDGFDPHLVLHQWREGGITVMPGVPFMFEVLAGLGDRGDRGSLRLVYSAGAMLPRSVFDAFLNRHGLSIGQLYGATEIGSVTFNHPSCEGFDPMSVGMPMEGVEIRIIDGQVAVRAPSMLSRYIGSDSESLRDGFFMTGDLGYLDSHGALTITGRLKLLIDVGGMKVNPLEVESVLVQHPMVRECIVVPVKVSATLVRLKAYLTPRNGGSVDVEDVRRFARERLAGYKVPRTFEVRDSLPKSAMGKVQRNMLTEGATP